MEIDRNPETPPVLPPLSIAVDIKWLLQEAEHSDDPNELEGHLAEPHADAEEEFGQSRHLTSVRTWKYCISLLRGSTGRTGLMQQKPESEKGLNASRSKTPNCSRL